MIEGVTETDQEAAVQDVDADLTHQVHLEDQDMADLILAVLLEHPNGPQVEVSHQGEKAEGTADHGVLQSKGTLIMIEVSQEVQKDQTERMIDIK